MLSKTVPQHTLNQSTFAPRHAAASRYVTAEPLRAHLEVLASARMSRSEIESASGVSRLTLLRLVRGDLDQVTPATAAAVLAVAPAPLRTQQHGWVDGTGTRRRLRALSVLGWPASELATQLGTSQSGVRRLMEDGHLCSASTRARVIAIYDQLWDQRPAPSRESHIARRRAEERGWSPALVWDDDTIDDPAAAPSNPTVVATAWSQRVEDIEWMLATGEVLATICARLGVTRAALERQMMRHRCSELWGRLTATETDWHTKSRLAA